MKKNLARFGVWYLWGSTMRCSSRWKTRLLRCRCVSSDIGLILIGLKGHAHVLRMCAHLFVSCLCVCPHTCTSHSFERLGWTLQLTEHFTSRKVTIHNIFFCECLMCLFTQRSDTTLVWHCGPSGFRWVCHSVQTLAVFSPTHSECAWEM